MNDENMANIEQASEVPPGPGEHVDLPLEEGTYLEEEYLFHDPKKPFGRVLSCFEFLVDGLPAVVDTDTIKDDGSSKIEVVGIVGTIYNKEGLFAQCGWFGGHDLDWYWVRIRGIRWLKVCLDPRFRRAERCVWLGTRLGEYAMLLPRDEHRDMWHSTVAGLGPGALAAAYFQIWPSSGPRPSWWDVRWKDDWPGEKEAGSKRRASTDVLEYEGMERHQGNAVGSTQWELLGPRGERGNQGEMRTNLNHRAQWVVRADGGIPATRHLNEKEKKEEEEKGGEEEKGNKGAPARGKNWRGRRGFKKRV
ncbi:hypothetical protein FRC07_008344 [Ceratobasidium sp. 392]|nr:hypothetical protein FRC07_008344 [Ceratobasidium sp. 392]